MKYRILAKIDDDMLKHYCNEDLFILEITTSSEEGMYDITLKELYDTWNVKNWKSQIAILNDLKPFSAIHILSLSIYI